MILRIFDLTRDGTRDDEFYQSEKKCSSTETRQLFQVYSEMDSFLLVGAVDKYLSYVFCYQKNCKCRLRLIFKETL